ncbi:hypothetical protein NC652_036741 [Populus alba x Populus x berolinensis]|uniref:Uncharacterized protein n=2 Tax=Populus TaxID=3689 RepID=A0ACC4ATR4_POPAL|nr:hypothetical protein NC651_035584 [Populus alba x Populus x berolinensis]KAJ6865070.1 hypothetical protein NC651_035588 [Populus alba x Populus x berolinensis]KAJ6871168.1 hypothetical protein NC652_036741 [Populus alba x Populus x berolinensis]KAJ6968669.1 hypothetical protein NC653_036600 [Populus alba x Populus x berolinensis]
MLRKQWSSFPLQLSYWMMNPNSGKDRTGSWVRSEKVQWSENGRRVSRAQPLQSPIKRARLSKSPCKLGLELC